MTEQGSSRAARLILVVDDEPQNIGLLKKRMNAGGHAVIAAESGREALDLARRERPDLVLLDLMMPDLDGLAVLERLRQVEETAQIPVIFVSADHDYDRRVEALSQGGHDYITKPFHPEELMARVNAALRTKDVYDRLQQQRRQLDEIARRDPLTALYNRRHLDEVLRQEYGRHAQWTRPLSVVLVDLDHFKQINDTFGHGTGDQVLCEVAALLRGRVREADIVGRFGGEEFLLVLPATSEAGAIQLAHELRVLVAQHEFPGCGQGVTFSAGVATAFAGAAFSGPEGLVALADMRLYEAKRAGRNRVAPGRG